MKYLANKYKARNPEETIQIIEKFFTDKGCTIKCNNKWHSEINTYSNEYCLFFKGKQILEAWGKGTSEIYAKASGYGELYERFCAFPISCWNTLNYELFYKINHINTGYFLDKQEKKVSLDELINNEFLYNYLYTINNDLDLDILNKFFNMRLSKDIYIVPYYNISNKEDIIYTIPALHGLASGSNGLAAGNTLEEALIQGVSELYERYVQSQFYLKSENKYYYLDINFLSENIKKLIENLNNIGYEVYIYDLSYNYNLPVCMILVLHKETNHYYMHFGSFPILDIAIERCLTEIYQENESLLDLKYNQGYTKLRDIDECNLNTITAHSIGYQPEIIINFNLINNSYKIDHCNNSIFLPSDDIDNLSILRQISKINIINNINFYYKDISLSTEMTAVHIICDNFNYTNIGIQNLKEYNEIYKNDNEDFQLAMKLGNQISNLLKIYLENKENSINLIDELNLYIESLPTESIEHRLKILDLISYLFSTELLQPYYIWYSDNINNNIIIPYYLAGYVEDVYYDLSSDLAKKVIPYEFYYKYCIQSKHPLSDYNKIMEFLNNNYKLENNISPHSFIEEVIFKNFQEIYNSNDHLEFIKLFIRKESNNE